jgi:hypothetical protein
METEYSEKQFAERQLQLGNRLMYVAVGAAVTIVFHVVNPLRDIIIMVTLLYTTLAGFSLFWGVAWGRALLTEARSKTIFGHLFASWLVVFGIFSYSRLSGLGAVLLGYTLLLVILYWWTRKKLSTSDEIFP